MNVELGKLLRLELLLQHLPDFVGPSEPRFNRHGMVSTPANYGHTWPTSYCHEGLIEGRKGSNIM